MNTYLLTTYQIDSRGKLVNGEWTFPESRTTIEVQADSAIDAVRAAAKVDGFRMLASLTARHQRAGMEAVRDNAYGQADSKGYRGYIAERVEAVDIIRQLDAKSRECFTTVDYTMESHRAFDAFMRELCGLLDGADYSVHS